MTSAELERNVADELSWDPKIDSKAIAVSVEDGIVTLRGTVGSLRQKREARKAAGRVRGVIYVNDDLEVKILTEQRREDADVRGDVLRALQLDSRVPTGVDATVKDGFVTLTGGVDWQYQRNEANFVAGNVPGVTGVNDQIHLIRSTPNTDGVEHSIGQAFTRDARLDANNLTVVISNGTATLTGTVRSWSDRDAAVAAAWSAPGITAVIDSLNVIY
jgi:osmotically-inducible protein OsmY